MEFRLNSKLKFTDPRTPILCPVTIKKECSNGSTLFVVFYTYTKQVPCLGDRNRYIENPC